uniref:Uncharacterized protein n=1 Tax=Oryza brachyantha TaxID=4533 RepID=J3MNC2_ORYBR
MLLLSEVYSEDNNVAYILIAFLRPIPFPRIDNLVEEEFVSFQILLLIEKKEGGRGIDKNNRGSGNRKGAISPFVYKIRIYADRNKVVCVQWFKCILFGTA